MFREPSHDLVFVAELVVEDVAHGGAERPAPVGIPDGEILADAVDLDRLQDDLDAERAEDARDQDQEPKLQPPAEVESAPAHVEEILPEGEVS